jgi:hypothetical protein
LLPLLKLPLPLLKPPPLPLLPQPLPQPPLPLLPLLKLPLLLCRVFFLKLRAFFLKHWVERRGLCRAVLLLPLLLWVKLLNHCQMLFMHKKPHEQKLLETHRWQVTVLHLFKLYHPALLLHLLHHPALLPLNHL